jgi:hypothetical protein
MASLDAWESLPALTVFGNSGKTRGQGGASKILRRDRLVWGRPPESNRNINSVGGCGVDENARGLPPS